MNNKQKGREIGRAIRAQSKLMMAAQGIELSVEEKAKAQDALAESAQQLSPVDNEAWRAGVYYGAGTLVMHSSKRYECLQGHVSQSNWTPSAVPALWKAHKEDCAAWSQPAGGHDAYRKGDKVSYNGKIFVSDIDANVWAPGVHGWSEVK